jgi:hypothetical protein
MASKITVVKILAQGEEFLPTRADMERWHQIFAENKMTVEEAVATGEVEIAELPLKEEGEHYLTIVQIGDDNYRPSMAELEQWRLVFEEAKNDPDFKIFTHPGIEISMINIGDIIAVE